MSARYDCGRHQLTTREIALLAGISQTTACNRVRRGLRGEALCAPAAPRGSTSPWRTEAGCSTHRARCSAAALRKASRR
ncbi:hypothetical protein CO641_02225 [Lysobacteraceae bacterium NML91-0213]|nr:hypothetical protein CO641_02225 [Xanthomonadaceae bacterium NML91-0213]